MPHDVAEREWQAGSTRDTLTWPLLVSGPCLGQAKVVMARAPWTAGSSELEARGPGPPRTRALPPHAHVLRLQLLQPPRTRFIFVELGIFVLMEKFHSME
jgi:hypothetical protein